MIRNDRMTTSRQFLKSDNSFGCTSCGYFCKNGHHNKIQKCHFIIKTQLPDFLYYSNF